MMHRSQGLGKNVSCTTRSWVCSCCKENNKIDRIYKRPLHLYTSLYITIHHYTSLYISAPLNNRPPDGNVALSYVAQLWFILWFMVDIASIHGLFVQPTFTSPLDHASSSHLGPPPTTKHAEGQLWPWIDSESTAQFWRRNRRVQWMEIQP